MNKQIKFLLLTGTSSMSFTYALTTPIINVYFMSQITSQVLATANMTSIVLAALVNSSIPNDKIKKFYRRNFLYIVIVDIVCFCLISFYSIEQINLRFLGFAVLNAISTNLWCIIMQDAINHNLGGDDLTNWNSFSRSIELWASGVGALLAIWFTQLDITLCVFLQCIANIVMGSTDYYCYQILNKTIEEETNGSNKRKENSKYCSNHNNAK